MDFYHRTRHMSVHLSLFNPYMTGFVQIQEEILGECDQMYTLASAQHCALENFIDYIFRYIFNHFRGFQY